MPGFSNKKEAVFSHLRFLNLVSNEEKLQAFYDVTLSVEVDAEYTLAFS